MTEIEKDLKEIRRLLEKLVKQQERKTQTL